MSRCGLQLTPDSRRDEASQTVIPCSALQTIQVAWRTQAFQAVAVIVCESQGSVQLQLGDSDALQSTKSCRSVEPESAPTDGDDDMCLFRHPTNSWSRNGFVLISHPLPIATCATLIAYHTGFTSQVERIQGPWADTTCTYRAIAG